MGIRVNFIMIAIALILACLSSCAGQQGHEGTTDQNETTVSETTAQVTAPDTESEETSELATTASETAPATEPETTAAVTEPAETWADETFIPFENSTICATEERVKRIRGDACVVVSRSEMLALGLDLPYDAEFFKDHSLVLVQFEGSGGEEAREVTHLVVRDGLIRPVVTIDSQENVSANFEYTLLTVEIERTNKKMEFGEVLVINNFNPSWGSDHRDRYEP